MSAIGTIRQLFVPRPPAAPRQVLPIKTFEPAKPQPKTIGPHSRAEDLVTCIGPGAYRIMVPRDRDPRLDAWLGRDPFTLAAEMTNFRLMKESLDGTLDWPDGFEPAKPKTREAQRAERVATIRRVAEGPNDFTAMLENEGIDPLEHPWEPSPDGRNTSTERRRGREILGLLRSRLFGK